MEAVVTGLTSGLSDIASTALGAMGTILPIALPILGGFLIVKVGKKIYSSVTGK